MHRKDKEKSDWWLVISDYFSFASVNTNSNPPPWLFLAEMVPPWMITEFFTIANPNPVPPSLRERPLSTR